MGVVIHTIHWDRPQPVQHVVDHYRRKLLYGMPVPVDALFFGSVADEHVRDYHWEKFLRSQRQMNGAPRL